MLRLKGSDGETIVWVKWKKRETDRHAHAQKAKIDMLL